MIDEKIHDPAQLKGFDRQGYRYSTDDSRPDHLVFLRDQPAD